MPPRVPRQVRPDLIRVEYYRAILPITQAAKAQVDKYVVPALPEVIPEPEQKQDADPRTAAKRRAAELVDRAEAAFERAFKPSELEAVVEKFGARTDTFQKEQLNRQVRSALGVGLDQIARSEKGIPAMVDGWVAINVDLITTIPADYFDDIRKQLIEGIDAGRRHEKIAEDLAERYGVAESRTALIARDQVGKLYGDLNEQRQQNLGVDGYFWRTSSDNRVRPEHEEREGERFAWNDPPEDGHPGEAVLCRCYAEPDFSSVLAEG